MLNNDNFIRMNRVADSMAKLGVLKKAKRLAAEAMKRSANFQGKAVVNTPQSRRCARFAADRSSGSVWSAEAFAPLCHGNHPCLISTVARL